MGNSEPKIYLLNGEDEFAISRYVDGIVGKLGDPDLVSMGTEHLDGREKSVEDLAMAAGAMPFMGSNRLVIYEQPTQRIKSPDAQKKLIAVLENIPETTTLVLVEPYLLTSKRDRESGKLNWLEKWARQAGSRVRVVSFEIPANLSGWILARAKELGGQFTQPAAILLAQYADRNPRFADQEIQKLLLYVNYKRPVEGQDVELLSADVAEGDIFILVDALGQRDIHHAMRMLHRLLERQDPAAIFAMVARQYRLLIQARYLLDQRIAPAQIAKQMEVHPYVAGKICIQAGNFSNSDLEFACRMLLDFDQMVKTSQIADELALDALVVSLGSAEPIHANPEMVW